MVSCVISHKVHPPCLGKNLVWSSPGIRYSRLTSSILLRPPNRKGPETSSAIVIILDILDQGSSPASIALETELGEALGGAFTLFYHISFTWVNHQSPWDLTLPAGSSLVVKHI